MEKNEKKDQLEKVNQMGYFSCTSYVVGGLSCDTEKDLYLGNIIGSGIFITPTSILQNVNSIGLALLIWFLCGVSSIIGRFLLMKHLFVQSFTPKHMDISGAIVYIELATAIPEPGCDFAYIVFVGWDAIAFGFMWVSTLMTYPASAAVQAQTFGQYIGKLFLALLILNFSCRLFSSIHN